MRIKDAALVAQQNSNRYIGDRFLPTRPSTLVDESAARLRTEIDSLPAELDEVSRKVLHWKSSAKRSKETDTRGAKPRQSSLSKRN